MCARWVWGLRSGQECPRSEALGPCNRIGVFFVPRLFAFLDEQSQRCRVTVEKISFAYRTDFAGAEKAGDGQRPQRFLNVAGVVVRLAE